MKRNLCAYGWFVVEAIIAGVLIIDPILTWQSADAGEPPSLSSENRQLAYNVMSGSFSTGITAISISLGFFGAIYSLAGDISRQSRFCIIIGVVWGCIALLAGLYGLQLLPQHVHTKLVTDMQLFSITLAVHFAFVVLCFLRLLMALFAK